MELTDYSVKRLALILAKQSEIEGMKAANRQHEGNEPYTDEQFQDKASDLENLAYANDDQLF